MRYSGRVLASSVRLIAVTALTAGLTLGSALPSRAADTINDGNVEAALAAAKTPADHEALAAYFTSKADEAQANIEKHKRMSGLFGGKGKSAWEGHCHALIRSFEEQAKDYKALASEQTAVAKALQGSK
jgi:hypothetical protein